MTFLVKTFVVLIALAVWLTLGLIIWVSLLFRIAAVYSFELLAAAAKNEELTNKSLDRMTSVIQIWPGGIRSILSIYSPAAETVNIQPFTHNWGELGRELVATLVVVVGGLLAFFLSNFLF